MMTFQYLQMQRNLNLWSKRAEISHLRCLQARKRSSNPQKDN